MPPDPPRVEGPSGLQQIYPPDTLKYPLVQKLIETPATVYNDILILSLYYCRFTLFHIDVYYVTEQLCFHVNFDLTYCRLILNFLCLLALEVNGNWQSTQIKNY